MTRNGNLGSASRSVIVIAALLGQAQTPKSGKDLFESRCGGCHALDREKEGPRLAGVYGRTAGSVAGFQYSGALLKSKLIWKEETLEKWLADPGQISSRQRHGLSRAKS